MLPIPVNFQWDGQVLKFYRIWNFQRHLTFGHLVNKFKPIQLLTPVRSCDMGDFGKEHPICGNAQYTSHWTGVQEELSSSKANIYCKLLRWVYWCSVHIDVKLLELWSSCQTKLFTDLLTIRNIWTTIWQARDIKYLKRSAQKDFGRYCLCSPKESHNTEISRVNQLLN